MSGWDKFAPNAKRFPSQPLLEGSLEPIQRKQVPSGANQVESDEFSAAKIL